MKTIEEYIEQICREHRDIRHEEGGQCHFSCTSDDDLTKMARTMRYPCVRLDVGEVYFTGASISETDEENHGGYYQANEQRQAQSD